MADNNQHQSSAPQPDHITLNLAAHGVEKSDARAVNAASERELYAKRQQIYPKSIKGHFRTIKWAFMALLLGVYYAVPFLRWQRPGDAPDQFVLVDFPGTKLYFGPIELWPQDFYLVSGILILSALALFLATALFGRVWCGYACPQTVWTDLYIAVETLIEGDRNQRIRLDKAPMSFNKLWRKTLKHIIWLVIALATGGWFVAYFHDAFDLARAFFVGKAPLSAYVFAGMLTFTTYTLAGFMREQVCTYMCPWPRIQGAMLDKDSLSVTYKVDRGEPRGAHKKNESWDGRGDCVDCRQCVAVCPAGIDIRDGLQIECINCALCIDACDEIMDKIGRPRGLISYESEANRQCRVAGKPTKFRFLRGRTIFYAVMLAVVGSAMLGLFVLRKPITLTVIRDRAPLFVTLSNGDVRNGYLLHLVNKSGKDQDLRVTIEGITPKAVRVLEQPGATGDIMWHVKADENASMKLFVEAVPDKIEDGHARINIRLDGDNGIHVRKRSVFIASNQHEE